MANTDLTAQRLRELLDYDSLTGAFTWKAERNMNNAPAGKVAGWIERPKYGKPRRNIEVDQRNYKAHRLAWLYVNGEWPQGVIDHINGDSTDNRIENLRATTQATNAQNRRKARAGSKSGLIGASWDAQRSKWVAILGVAGKQVHLGRFNTAEEAQTAYLDAKRRLHEGCTI